jgi:predicted small secreted protein
MIVVTFIVGAIIGFCIGMLVWRNNARKFREIENALVKAGKTVMDLKDLVK